VPNGVLLRIEKERPVCAGADDFRLKRARGKLCVFCFFVVGRWWNNVFLGIIKCKNRKEKNGK